MTKLLIEVECGERDCGPYCVGKEHCEYLLQPNYELDIPARCMLLHVDLSEGGDVQLRDPACLAAERAAKEMP